MDADNLTTSAEQPPPPRVTHCPRCTKELTSESCASWSRDTGFHPRPCENCKGPGCDDCSDHWAVCVCCGGGVCHDCVPAARSRVVTDAPAYGAPCRTRTEVLCVRCATSQDAAKSRLSAVIGELNDEYEFSFGHAWLSDIVSDLSDAIRKAKEAL